uniref:Protein lifeguard 2 n=1 Tax=Catharus ustulatus TaxID=91951 RepID=A0A8C3UYY3_CATUS
LTHGCPSQGKPPSSEGQGDKKDNGTAPPAPPSYEEATAGEGMKAGAFPAPPAAPLHPSWAYVDPSTSPSYGSGGYPGDTELLTTFSWDDRNVRRVFIRKVYAILMVQLLVTVVIVAFFTFCEPVKGYIQTHSAWYWASYLDGAVGVWEGSPTLPKHLPVLCVKNLSKVSRGR